MNDHELREGCDIRLKTLESEVKDMKEKISDLPKFTVLLEQVIESSKENAQANREMSKSISDFNVTLVKVSNTMERLSDDQSEMKTDIEDLKQDKSDRMIDPQAIQKESITNTINKFWYGGGIVGIIMVAYEGYKLITG